MKHLHNYSNQLKTQKHCISLPFILKIMDTGRIKTQKYMIYFIFKLQIISFVESYGL